MIEDLTKEVERLNKALENKSLGVQMLSTSENPVQQSPTKIEQDPDTSMDEMALFHDIFNSNLFGTLNLDSNRQDTSYTLPLTQPPEQESSVENMIDLSSLDFLNSFPTDGKFKIEHLLEAPSPQPLEFVPPKTVPKRTTNGKKIRYSKNVRLAHSALRMAREQTASVNTPSDDMLSDFTKQKSNQLVFKQHPTNVNKQLNANDEVKHKKEKKKMTGNNTKSTTTTTANNNISGSPKQSILSPSSQPNGVGPKKRPMFILASSYLSNYGSGNQES